MSDAAGLSFVPLERLGNRPHVLVDGAARPGTVLTLSHWPGTPTPTALERDTSTEIVLAWLEAGGDAAGATAATADHPDADGALALFCAVAPDLAHAHAGRCAAAAATGDFDVVTDRAGARLAFALRHLLDAARTPLRVASAAFTSAALALALAELPALLVDPERFVAWWGPEDAAYERGLARLVTGEVAVREEDVGTLAVVESPAVREPEPFARAGRAGLPVHAAAVHGASAAARVLVRNGARVLYYDRYETWVRFCSRPLPARRDLVPLAAQLTAEEPDGARWSADPPSSIVPVLAPLDSAPSALSPERVEEIVRTYLAAAPPAWSGEGPVLSRPAGPRGGTSGRGRPRSRGR